MSTEKLKLCFIKDQSFSSITRMFYLLCLFLSIRADITEIKFKNIDNKQHISIEVYKPFEFVTYACLMKKKGDGFVEHTNVGQYTKAMYFEKDINLIEDFSDTGEDELPKDVYEVVVNMGEIKKVPDTTYNLKFKTDTNLEIETQPFYYSRKTKKWEVGYAFPPMTKKQKLFLYIRLVIEFIAFTTLLIIGFIYLYNYVKSK